MERFPFYCQWEITCRCNLRCVMCYTDCYNTPEKIREELSTPEILRILAELAESGCTEICFTGGEPLSRPDFFEIYEAAKRRGFLITIFTNATLITEAVADRLAEWPPHLMEISLHGMTEGTFEKITQGRGSFGRCLNAIQLLLQRKIPLVLKATAMTLNKEELLEIKRYVQSLGAGVRFKMGETMTRTLDGSDSPKVYELADEELQSLERRDAEIWKEICEESGAEAVCQSGKTSFHIDAYGQLQLCSGNRRKGYDLRKGSFREGFYEFLPHFPCPLKIPGNSSAEVCGNHERAV